MNDRRQQPQPANWPFPPLGPIQARNHARCVASLQELMARQHAQRVRECVEAAREALL